MDLERLERLKKVLARIERSENYPTTFEQLEEIRKQEYHLEGGSSAEYVMGNYRHNLEQTGSKQAESYKRAKAKRPVKGAPSEYADYIRNFKHDVSDEIHRMEMRLNYENNKS